jgi:hypothetical protein
VKVAPVTANYVYLTEIIAALFSKQKYYPEELALIKALVNACLLGDPPNKSNPNFLPDFLQKYIKFEKMYHITIQEYDHKIKKYGLFPKSKSKLSSHTDRIYLCKSIEDCEMLIPQMKLYYSEERDTNLYKLNNKKYRKNTKWILYEIDNTSNLKLYKDPRYINGYYTLDNINPQDIREIKRE